jgi:hypothetical protein
MRTYENIETGLAVGDDIQIHMDSRTSKQHTISSREDIERLIRHHKSGLVFIEVYESNSPTTELILPWHYKQHEGKIDCIYKILQQQGVVINGLTTMVQELINNK